MSDRLSQKQLDEIFNSALEGAGAEEALESILVKEKEKEQYTDYNFNRPDKFNVENIKSLQSIAETFARNFTQSFSAQLRTPVLIRIPENDTPTIEQQPYGEEYVEKMSQGQFAFCVVDLGVKGLGKILLELDLNWVVPVYRNLLGKGKMEILEKRKELTEIEKIATQEWLDTMLMPQLKDAFKNVATFKPKVETIVEDAQFAKITSAADMVVLIAFEIVVSEKVSSMRIVIPYMALESIMDKFTTENIHEYLKYFDEEDKTETIKSHLKMVTEKVDIELGKSRITLRELLQFSEGDVLLLDKSKDEHLTGYISDLPKFSCQPGKRDNKIAVKITGFAEKEGIINEQ